MKSIKSLLFLVLLTSMQANAQQIIPLYSSPIPGAKPQGPEVTESPANSGMIRVVINPTLEAYLPEKDKATGTAVIIIPGGGYSVIVYSSEGTPNAKELASNGVAAFVLKYRLPSDAVMADKTIGPLQDAQQAIKVVRERAAEWGINPNKIGIMGFSAGGHLASTLATHYAKPVIENSNNTSLRPDFQVLVYPVVTMQENLTHRDSRKQLLGQTPSKELVDLYSNELQVNENTPKAWIAHAADDVTVDVDNSINYFEALRRKKVPVEMHIYPKGGHGLGGKKEAWMSNLLKWMQTSL